MPVVRDPDVGAIRRHARGSAADVNRADDGAENVAVSDLGYVLSRENPLFAKLAAGLG